MELTLADVSPFRLTLGVLGGYSGTASQNGHDLENGTFYQGSLMLNQAGKSFNIYSEIFYRKEEQDSSIVEQEMTEVGISFGVKIPFGGK